MEIAKLLIFSPDVQMFSNPRAFGVGFGDSKVSGAPDLFLSAGMESGLSRGRCVGRGLAEITLPSLPCS